MLFTVGKDDLYKIKHTPEQDQLIHILLRSYTGLFTETAYINEETLANRLTWTRDDVYNQLVGLAKERVIQYIPRKKTPFLTFVREREATERVILDKESYDNRRERYIDRVKSVLDYAKEENICRSQVLLSYFGEKNTKPCGKCDICLKQKETTVSDEEFENIKTEIIQKLTAEKLTVNALVRKMPYKEPKVLQVLRFMMDNGQLSENEMMKLQIDK